MNAPKQLSLLRADERPQGISIYRVKSWPATAISVEQVYQRAGKLMVAWGTRSPALRITVHANRRVSVSIRLQRGHLAVRLHWQLLDDPDKLRDAILYAHKRGRFPDWTGDWLRAHTHAGGTVARPLHPNGTHRDLRRYLSQVSRYLPAQLEVPNVDITWGRRSPKRKRPQRRIRLGSFVAADALIRVHPVLDDPRVPEWVLEHIVYHELCHAVAPPISASAARAGREHRIHHHRFLALEARFPRLKEAEAWVRANLDQLLQAAS